MTEQKQRKVGSGGKRPGAGRKAKQPERKMVTTSIRLYEDQVGKVSAEEIREMIDSRIKEAGQ